jgi:glucosylceramidase
MKSKKHIVRVCVFLFVAVPLFAQSAYFRTTVRLGEGTTVPYCTPWIDSGGRAGTAWASTNNYIEIFPSTTYQTVMGWGGTIQEKHWEAMKVLSAAGKDSIMRALFDTSGCNISFLRVPIGCCDFDLNEAPISLNETAGDYEMTKFSLHRDSTRKIPLIKMAQAINPNIRFWGCPWSPPRWMHDNGDFTTGNMKSDAQTLTAYALYLEKFVLGYKDAGINVEWVCCQNEPNIVDGGYPKCGWTNALELNFYKNYLVPRFKQSNLSARIILGVFCCGEYADWITYFMNDATVKGFVGVTSHSYQAPDWGLKSYNDYPTVPFFQTEAPFHWPEDGIQDWTRGIEEIANVADFMNNRTAVYHMWNMVNDQTGKSGFNWAQNVMIQVHSSTKQVTYNPHFWAYKHFGNYVKAGAKAVRYTVNGTNPTRTNAFLNPNGDIILVLFNQGGNPFPLTAKVGNTMWKATLPGYSFNTLKIAIGTAVQERKLENTAIPAQNKAQINAWISNSMLHLTLPPAAGAQEMNLILSDLQGRTVWTGRRGGSAMLEEQQTFAIHRPQGGLLPGTYLLTVRIKNSRGAVTTVDNIVTAVN